MGVLYNKCVRVGRPVDQQLHHFHRADGACDTPGVPNQKLLHVRDEHCAGVQRPYYDLELG